MRHHKKKKPGGGSMGMRCVPHQKEAFRTKQAAVNALARYVTRRTSGGYPPRRAYPADCGFWHLTSKP